MLFQITQISMSESDYVTLRSVINIATQDSIKMTNKKVTMMVFTY